jgi:cell pole-organizing protein PopZ
MTQAAKSQEPSMEEILASIRRIIADDDATKTVPRAPDPPRAEPLTALPPQPAYAAPPNSRFELQPLPAAEAPGAAVADQSADILDLTESMAAMMPQPPAVNPPASAAPSAPSQFRTIDGDSDVGFAEAVEAPAPPPAPPAPPVQRAALISNATSAAVDSAFNALAQTVLVQNARTLEDLVREMLRPMLKSWLDDNLPGMVERLVRAEIERVSRGRAS